MIPSRKDQRRKAMVPEKLIRADCHIAPPYELINELPESYREYFPHWAVISETLGWMTYSTPDDIASAALFFASPAA
jgi:hypothetical protein